MYTMIMILINRNSFEKSPEKECAWEISWILYSHFYATDAAAIAVDLWQLAVCVCVGETEMLPIRMSFVISCQQMRKAFTSMYEFQLRWSFCYFWKETSKWAHLIYSNNSLYYYYYTFSFSHTNTHEIRYQNVCVWLQHPRTLISKGQEAGSASKKSRWTRFWLNKTSSNK